MPLLLLPPQAAKRPAQMRMHRAYVSFVMNFTSGMQRCRPMYWDQRNFR